MLCEGGGRAGPSGWAGGEVMRQGLVYTKRM